MDFPSDFTEEQCDLAERLLNRVIVSGMRPRMAQPVARWLAGELTRRSLCPEPRVSMSLCQDDMDREIAQEQEQ